MAKNDLIFFEKRSTPKVMARGKHFVAPESYGKQTLRRPATEEEEKQIARGDWVRVDEHGTKGGQPGYKKTRMAGRQHLVQSGILTSDKPSLEGVYLAHFGVKGMKWGRRKVRPDEAQRKKAFGPKGKMSTQKKVALGAAVVAGTVVTGVLLTKYGKSPFSSSASEAIGTVTSRSGRTSASPAQLRQLLGDREPTPTDLRILAGYGKQRQLMDQVSNQRLTDKTWRDASRMSQMAKGKKLTDLSDLDQSIMGRTNEMLRNWGNPNYTFNF